jgi:hypothetical protein
MAACLWQANPSMNNMQVADAIRQSASQYNSPDEMLGYGIPDFIMANNILTVIGGPVPANETIEIYPNPFSESFTIDLGKLGDGGAGDQDFIIEIFDITGRIIGTEKVHSANSSLIKIDVLQNSSDGLYLVRISRHGAQALLKLVKDR